MNRISRTFLVFGALSLLVAPACSNGPDALSGAAGLVEGEPDPGTTDPEEEQEAPSPEEQHCFDLEDAVNTCFDDAEQACAPNFEALDICINDHHAACEPLWVDAEDCVNNGGDCDPLIEAAEECMHHAEVACEGEHEQVMLCVEPCEQLAHELEETCAGPPDSCGLLFEALDACFEEGRGPECGVIEHAIEELCHPCPDDEEGHEGEEGEAWPEDAEDYEEDGEEDSEDDESEDGTEPPPEG